jgi:GNAT superfamily N-acetyltransferase
MVVTTYQGGQDIPKKVVASLRQMGYTNDLGHMRHVIREAVSDDPLCPENKTRLYDAFVGMVDDKVVGWACVYRIENDLCCSIWVSNRHRRKGYGHGIMERVYELYKFDPPELFGRGRKLWNMIHAEAPY